MYTHFCPASARTLKFIKHSSLALGDHITGTQCRPDLVAISAGISSDQAPQSPYAPGGDPVSPSSQALQSPNIPESQSSDLSYKPQSSDSSQPSESSKGQAVSWAEIETVVELASKVKKRLDGTKQGVAYTSYLLEQRPDRVAVCGLYISLNRFSLVLMDAANVYYTMLRWDDLSARNLLLRVLWYIKDPPKLMIDPTVTRTKDSIYTIKIEDKDYEGYRLESCGHPIGRRTVVFRCEGADFPVIKEQYVRCPVAEILEKTILSRVHEGKEVPGVVRFSWCGWVTRDDGSSIECGMGRRKRQKVRFVLRDEGTLFMEIPTPYDALVTAWDTLEGK